MFKPLYNLALATAFVGLIAPAHAEDVNADTVVATVNGTEITLGHMLALRKDLPAQYQTIPDPELFKGILDQLVTQTVLSQALQGDDTRAIRLATENHRSALRATTVVDQLTKMPIPEEDLQKAYEAKFAGADMGLEYNASHILVETEEKAAELIEMLNGGADFATLAKTHSTGPSGPGGGQLGWFGPGMMVPPFEAAVVELEVGEVSQPVQTQFGWHVVILNGRRAQEAPLLDEVREELTAELRDTAVTAAIDALVDAANVDKVTMEQFGADYISKLDLLED